MQANFKGYQYLQLIKRIKNKKKKIELLFDKKTGVMEIVPKQEFVEIGFHPLVLLTL